MPHTESLPRLHYWQEGQNGPRVLLIMGFAMRGEMWRPQLDGLRNSFQVATLDNRGVGGSETDDQPASMALFAEDTDRVLDALGWQAGVHLVGVSMGGMIAQHVAVRSPHRFRSLTLIATHYGGRLAWFPAFRAFGKLLWAKMPFVDNYGHAMARVLYPTEFLRVEHARVRERMAAQFAEPVAKKVVRAQFRAVRGHRTRAALSQLRLPTLVVKPGRDILCRPRHSNRLATAIPTATLRELPDAGHGIIFQSAAQLNTLLENHFLAAESAA